MSGHAAHKGGVQAPYSKPRPRFNELLGDLATGNEEGREGEREGGKGRKGRRKVRLGPLSLYNSGLLASAWFLDLSVGGDRCLNRQRCPKQEILGILLIGAFVQRSCQPHVKITRIQ